MVSQAGFPNGTDTAILARADEFPDALAGAPLAFKLHAPILLTLTETLPDGVIAEIQRLAPQKIILLGGTAAISAGIEQQLRGSYSVQRLGGSNRYATAALIASALGTLGQAVVVNGTNFPDAISMASIAARQGMPILLTDADILPVETDTVLCQFFVSETTVAGGEGVVIPDTFNDLPNPTRVSGNDRYATAAAVLQANPPQGSLLFLATGENFPDALTGGVLAALDTTDIVLVPVTGPSPDEVSVIQTWHDQNTYVLGGSSVVPDVIGF